MNAQQRSYYITSTSGGFCGIKMAADGPERKQHCPEMFDCHDESPKRGRLWYNRPNIDNDYPRFEEKSGARDTILLTFLTTRPKAMTEWLKRHSGPERRALETAIWEYIRGGLDGCSDREMGERFAHWLEYSNRKHKPILTDFGIRWFMLSDIVGNRVDWWLTGGVSIRGRPPIKYCLPESRARREGELIEFLRKTDDEAS